MIAAGFLALFCYFFVSFLIPIFDGLRRESYQRKPLPTALGLAFVLPAGVFLAGRQAKNEHSLCFAVLVLFFALLGFLDDSLGDSAPKGWGGHLKTQGLTTGGLKALGGLALSWALGSFYALHWGEAFLNGLLIALAANWANLLDLRPGRTGKAFLVLGTPLFLCHSRILEPLLWLGAALIGYLAWDLKGAVMMGDAGSNALGAALGLAVVIVWPRWGRIFLTLILLGLNLLAERCSFSRIIESNRFLRFLDQIGRPPQKG